MIVIIEYSDVSDPENHDVSSDIADAMELSWAALLQNPEVEVQESFPSNTGTYVLVRWQFVNSLVKQDATPTATFAEEDAQDSITGTSQPESPTAPLDAPSRDK